jgi:hypothetical protein
VKCYTNDEVGALNEAARGKLRDAGQLGDDVCIKAERGDRQFASGDRLMFLRNDRDLGVKNGSLGNIDKVNPHSMTVKLDDGRSIAFDIKNYAHIDHGYAATIHKSQGVPQSVQPRINFIAGFDLIGYMSRITDRRGMSTITDSGVERVSRSGAA